MFSSSAMRSATVRAASLPRLGVADLAPDAAAQFKADLWQLGRLARARLAGHDDDLIRLDRLTDVGDPGGDRQLGGVGDRRDAGTAPFQARLGRFDRRGDAGAIGIATGGRQPPPQPVRIAKHQLADAPAQPAGRGMDTVLIRRGQDGVGHAFQAAMTSRLLPTGSGKSNVSGSGPIRPPDDRPDRIAISSSVRSKSKISRFSAIRDGRHRLRDGDHAVLRCASAARPAPATCRAPRRAPRCRVVEQAPCPGRSGSRPRWRSGASAW